jgi:hypothetical protein
MNPLSILERAVSLFEKTVKRGTMQVFKACRLRKPESAYEEYRCVNCRSVRIEGSWGT